MTADPPKDPTGRAIVVGCRVSVAPRVPGAPFLLVDPEDAESPRTPRVSGRVDRIYEGKQGLYVDVRCSATSAWRTVPADLCRVQPGMTTKERRLSQAEEKGQRLR